MTRNSIRRISGKPTSAETFASMAGASDSRFRFHTLSDTATISTLSLSSTGIPSLCPGDFRNRFADRGVELVQDDKRPRRFFVLTKSDGESGQEFSK